MGIMALLLSYEKIFGARRSCLVCFSWLVCWHIRTIGLVSGFFR